MVQRIKLFICITLLLFNNVTYASDRLPAGTVLSQESYVFTVEEAQRIKITIEQLEAQVKNNQAIIEQYKLLDETQLKEIEGYSQVVKLQEKTILTYEDWRKLDQERMLKLEKVQNRKEIENWAFFGVGIITTISAIVVADKLDDALENN